MLYSQLSQTWRGRWRSLTLPVPEKRIGFPGPFWAWESKTKAEATSQRFQFDNSFVRCQQDVFEEAKFDNQTHTASLATQTCTLAFEQRGRYALYSTHSRCDLANVKDRVLTTVDSLRTDSNMPCISLFMAVEERGLSQPRFYRSIKVVSECRRLRQAKRLTHSFKDP